MTMLGVNFRFIEDIRLTNVFEDWSGVRSPARARRRRRRGFPQRIKTYLVPKPDIYKLNTPGGVIFTGHPETIRKFKEKLREQTLAAAIHR